MHLKKYVTKKQLVKNGFFVFEEIKKGTPEGHSSHKKRRYNFVTS